MQEDTVGITVHRVASMGCGGCEGLKQRPIAGVCGYEAAHKISVYVINILVCISL